MTRDEYERWWSRLAEWKNGEADDVEPCTMYKFHHPSCLPCKMHIVQYQRRVRNGAYLLVFCGAEARRIRNSFSRSRQHKFHEEQLVIQIPRETPAKEILRLARSYRDILRAAGAWGGKS